MDTGLEAELSREEVNVEAVIRSGTGGKAGQTEQLRELKSRLQRLADESSASLRKNVVSNYAQFIETAKEISYLESEMYQLSHLLTQQKELLEGLMAAGSSGIGGKSVGVGGESWSGGKGGGRSLESVLERVEGVGFLREEPGRYLLLDGELSLLEAESGRKASQIHAFLLNDALLLTSFMPQRLGSKRYRLEQQYSLETVALADVADSESFRNAFKLLVFPHHKLLAAESPRVKKEWLAAVEKAKKQLLQEGSLARQGTIRSKFGGSMRGERGETASGGGGANFTGRRGSEDARAEEDVEWLRELPDEIEVCLAQREWETCLELLAEGRGALEEGCGDEGVGREVSAKLVAKERQLVSALARELRSQGERSGPKAARKAMALLTKLGKASYAVDLYLKARSGQVRVGVKELRIAEEPLSYVRSLCGMVCGSVGEVAREVPSLFAGESGCIAMVVLWASGELRQCVELLLRHVVEPGPSLGVVAQSCKILLGQTRQLSELGLDLRFEVEQLLSAPVAAALQQSAHNTLEGARLRAAEDKWRPYNSGGEGALARLLEEMNELGLPLDAYVEEDPLQGAEEQRSGLWLSEQSLHAGRLALQLARDLALLACLPDIARQGLASLLSLWQLHLAHLQTALAAKDKPPAHRRVAETSATFLIADVMPKCEVALSSISNAPPTPLQTILATQFPALAVYRPAPNKSAPSFEILGDV